MATLKIQSAEIEPFWATPQILLFLMMIFFNFFHNHRVQKYQNEISPTIYYGISTKNNEKDLKIPNLQLSDWKHPYWMTLYVFHVLYSSQMNCWLNWAFLLFYDQDKDGVINIIGEDYDYYIAHMPSIVWSLCLTRHLMLFDGFRVYGFKVTAYIMTTLDHGKCECWYWGMLGTANTFLKIISIR